MARHIWARQQRVTVWCATPHCSRVRLRLDAFAAFSWGLTFDMRGGRQLAKPDVARPLDGRVSPQLVACTTDKGRLPWRTRWMLRRLHADGDIGRTAIVPAFVFRCIARCSRVHLFAGSVTPHLILRLVRWHSCPARPLRPPTRDWAKRDNPEIALPRRLSAVSFASSINGACKRLAILACGRCAA